MKVKNPKLLFTRTFVFMLDVLCVLVVALLGYLMTYPASFPNNENYQLAVGVQRTVLVETNLGYHDEKTGSYHIYNKDEYFIDIDGQPQIVDVMEYFYVNYLNEMTVSQYRSSILGVGSVDCWKIVEDKVTVSEDYLKDETKMKKLESYLGKKYAAALNRFYNLPEVSEARDIITKEQKNIFYNWSIFGIVIFFFIVPLYKKRGETLFQRIFGLNVWSRTSEFLSFPQILLRPLLLFTISIYLMFVPGWYGVIYPAVFALFSLGLILFTKDDLSVFDAVSDTQLKEKNEQPQPENVYNKEEE